MAYKQFPEHVYSHYITVNIFFQCANVDVALELCGNTEDAELK